MKKKLFIILGILFIFVPLGLISEYSAWGEWENQYYQKMLGYIPKGIEEAKGITPLIPDYGEGNLIIYYVSAMIGVIILFWIFYMLLKSGKNVTN